MILDTGLLLFGPPCIYNTLHVNFSSFQNRKIAIKPCSVCCIHCSCLQQLIKRQHGDLNENKSIQHNHTSCCFQKYLSTIMSIAGLWCAIWVKGEIEPLWQSSAFFWQLYQSSARLCWNPTCIIHIKFLAKSVQHVAPDCFSEMAQSLHKAVSQLVTA